MDELIQEYIELSYQPQKPDYRVKDYIITDLIILRMDGDYWKILYLENGNSLWISWKWIDFFSGLYCYAGDQIKSDDFIGLMIKLQTYTLAGMERGKGNQFLETLGNICEIGTEEFRKKFPVLELNPFELKRIEGTIEI